MEKGKKGFSSLAELTSEQLKAEDIPSSTKASIASKIEPSVFSLLELTKWPTLPAPWSSTDSGETWVWGDFFLTFQKNPKSVLDLSMEMQGEKAEYRGMTYHYSMSAFYRLDKNPHGPSHRPIMVVTLEQADMGMLAKMLDNEAGERLQTEAGSKMGPLMIGTFIGESRFNLGEFDKDVSAETVKRRFFEILRRQLALSGQPKMIGDLAKAHGHPETGLPAKKKINGCAPAIFLCIGICGLWMWGLNF